MHRLTRAQRRQIRKKAGKDTGLEWRLPGHQRIRPRAVVRAQNRALGAVEWAKTQVVRAMYLLELARTDEQILAAKEAIEAAEAVLEVREREATALWVEGVRLVGRAWPPDALMRGVIEKARDVGHVLMSRKEV